MNSQKAEELKELEDRKKNYSEALEKLERLEKPLKSYTKKLVDKRFFEANFLQENNYGNKWTEFKYWPKRYNFQEHNHEVYLNNGNYLELNTRETEELKKAIETKKELLILWIGEINAKMETLNGLDEIAIKKDLVSIFEKYGKPSIWREILDSFEVKYPKSEDN